MIARRPPAAARPLEENQTAAANRTSTAPIPAERRPRHRGGPRADRRGEIGHRGARHAGVRRSMRRSRASRAGQRHGRAGTGRTNQPPLPSIKGWRARMPRRGKGVDYPGGSRSTYARTPRRWRASAGKNDSIDSSLAVTSTAVPNVATVLMKASSPASVRRRSGTASSAGRSRLGFVLRRRVAAAARRAARRAPASPVSAICRAGAPAGARATHRGWRSAAPRRRGAGSTAARSPAARAAPARRPP